MTEFLCLGGPLHGETLDVPVPENGITIKPPERAFLLRKEGDPIPQPLHYVARTLGAQDEDGNKYVRTVMAVEQIPGPQLMMALADVLVKEWLREGNELGQDGQHQAGADGGLRVPDGSGSDGGAGTGLIAP